jgi:hypothetical protein
MVSWTSKVVPDPFACHSLIVVVTRSGRLIEDDTEPELDSGVELTIGPDSDPWASPVDETNKSTTTTMQDKTPGIALREQPTVAHGEDPIELDYSSDSTEGDKAEDETRSGDNSEPDHGPNYSWDSEIMQEEQDEDNVINRVWSWVATGAKPSPEELDVECQETRALVSCWTELAVVEEIWTGPIRGLEIKPGGLINA